MFRRHMLQVTVALLPALALAPIAVAQPQVPSGQHAGKFGLEDLHQMMQDIPGPEFSEANRLKNEALHATLMGADLQTVQPKLIAFADEYARVAGTEQKAMEAHVLEVGAQIVELAKDPTFKAHLAAMHAGH